MHFITSRTGLDGAGTPGEAMSMPVLLRFFFIILIAFAPATLRAEAARSWQTWDGCVLLADHYFDGDSFQVKYQGRTYVLRLYFVDTPEIDASYPQRVEQQAAYFGVTPAQALRAGETAKEFTARFLARSFRVYTRLQPAPGASRLERHYAIVERDGQRLDTALVQAGLARVTSEAADFPDEATARRRSSELRALETQAAQGRKNLWAQSQRTDRRATLTDRLKPLLTANPSALPAPRKVNLNTANTADLIALPGVGPKTAAEIIAARPLADLSALDALPGFGPKKIEALRDLVTFR